MQIEQYPRPKSDSKIGYRLDLSGEVDESAASAALARAQALGASWVTLSTPADRPVSEDLVREAIGLGLEPVVWIDVGPSHPLEPSALASTGRRLARAGGNYVCVYDRPNTARVWAYEEWRQPGLPHRFAALLAPLLETIHANGLCPVIGPLAPGGHYWDLTFLGQLIGALARESRRGWLDRLALSVVDREGRWDLKTTRIDVETPPRPTPYSRVGLPTGTNLTLTRWYDVLAREHLGRSLPILALDAVPRSDPIGPSRESSNVGISPETVDDVRDQLRRGALPEYRFNVSFGPVPPTPIADESSRPGHPIGTIRGGACESVSTTEAEHAPAFNHYLLLCSSESPEANRWSLTGLMGAILPYVGKFRPTVGFSVEEAARAGRVTIVGPDADELRRVEDSLKAAGRLAEAIPADSVGDLKQMLAQLAGQDVDASSARRQPGRS